MLYIMDGEDEFSQTEAIGRLRSKLGDPSTSDLNTAVLNGAKSSIEDIIHHCDTVPFLSERRLVIVERMLSRSGSKSRSRTGGKGGKAPTDADDQPLDRLLGYLPRLPDFTDLVFVEHERVASKNAVVAYARKHKQQSEVQRFDPPRGDQLVQWIVDRGRKKGTRVEARAAHELSIHVGGNLRLLDGEVEKLAVYVGAGQSISHQDVRRLVTASKKARIFDLVDAMGNRQSDRAVNLLHKLEDDGSNPLYLLSMIVRQFRLISMYQQLARSGQPAGEIQQALGIRHSFILDKLARQSRNFTPAQLHRTHHRLLATDQLIKTGGMEPTLALDLLVVELTGRSAA